MNALRVRKDVETREVTLEREVAASRDRVWASWTTATDLEAWWGPAGWTTTIRSLDIRPGGLWHFGMGPDGQVPEVWIRAVYSEVIHGSSLSYVEGFSDETGADLDPESNAVTVDFIELDPGVTRIAMRDPVLVGRPARADRGARHDRGLRAGIRPPGHPPGRKRVMSSVTSADGTPIEFWRTGDGPVIVLIDAALSMHTESAKLAALLAPRFTVITYDRRGRGGSGETLPADHARETEDIEALIDANGGTASLFGSSSGAVLALDAATRLGRKVTGLFMYEPPFIVDDSRPPLPSGLPTRIADLVDRNHRSEAVTAFYREAMGIPAPFVTAMRLFMPSWKQAKRIAHTLRYDFGTLAGTQDGEPLPAARWSSLRAPSKVMVGSRSEPFFHSGARALAEALPAVEYESLEGGHHGSAVMSPAGLATAITAFFRP